jgi:hypothetical protein
MSFSEEELYGAIARGWCDERNSGKEMDVDLADAIAIEVLAVVRSRIATLETQLEQARAALECIVNLLEHDSFALRLSAFGIAQLALQALREGGER